MGDVFIAVTRIGRRHPRQAGLVTGVRQRLVLNRLLDGFEGRLTTSKWAKIAKCSTDTAPRDILDLVERGLLVRNPAAAAAPVTRSIESHNSPW